MPGAADYLRPGTFTGNYAKLYRYVMRTLGSRDILYAVLAILSTVILWSLFRSRREARPRRGNGPARNAAAPAVADDEKSESVEQLDSNSLSELGAFGARFLNPVKPGLKVAVAAGVVLRGRGVLEIDKAAVSPLKTLAKYTKLYVVQPCDSDETEKMFADLLEREGVVASGLQKHRIIPCSTGKGMSAIFRHLEPHVLICDDHEVTASLAPFLSNVLHVGRDNVDENQRLPSVTYLTSWRALFAK